MKRVTVEAFKNIVAEEAGNPEVDLINVCTPSEYTEKHIAGVRNVPLSELEAHQVEFADKKTIYVHCQSGVRSERAIAELKHLGVTADLVLVSGGLMAWEQAGLETNSHTENTKR